MIKVVAKHFMKVDRIHEFLERANELIEASLKEEGVSATDSTRI